MQVVAELEASAACSGAIAPTSVVVLVVAPEAFVWVTAPASEERAENAGATTGRGDQTAERQQEGAATVTTSAAGCAAAAETAHFVFGCESACVVETVPAA